MGLDIYFNKVKRTEIGYFRKVNFLVAYFEKLGMDVERQAPISFGLEELNDLIEKCKAVLADNSRAEELLPTMDGFFFGNTEYNECYFNDVSRVLDLCEELKADGLADDEVFEFSIWY